MKNNNEKQILKIIKYAPSSFVIIFSMIITIWLYVENKSIFQKEKKQIENEYILETKNKLKSDISLVYNIVNNSYKNIEVELKNSIKTRVYEAHTIATNIYEKYKNTKTKDEIFELIKVTLNEIRFNNGRGYFFIDNIEGRKVLYPIDSKIENKIMIDYRDSNGYEFVKTIIKTIKDKSERFDEYYWYKPNKGMKTYKKISFYKYLEPYNMVIGTGEYVDEYEAFVKEKTLKYLTYIKKDTKKDIFILDYSGRFVLYKDNKFIGKNVLDVEKDKSVKDLIENMPSMLNKHSLFIEYKASNNNRIGYAKKFNDWSWILVSSYSKDKMGKLIQDKKEFLDNKYESFIYKIFTISIILTFVLLIVSIYISKTLKYKFDKYKKDLNEKQNILFQQSKMASMGEMIGNIAHQWRQPLSTILTASTGMLLQKQMNNLEDEFFFDATKRINASVKHLSKTIDDFRNFYSPHKIKTNFSLKNTFNTTLDLLQAQLTSKDIRIVKDIEDIEMFSYENELIQALINIINNARDELIKKDKNVEKVIFISSIVSAKKVSIIIRDNAGGISADIIERIFEPYFTTKHKAQGTGIGLYMTEEIIVKHLDGKISVKNHDFIYNNKKYTGAEFTIEFDL
ncbi:sensor histidine kinase [Poseidonibacter antarcticus]|uniref:sensor histidine kinase n=1 Tax=Poseidonibacter antarcticus TaxID=2478538 RepID=UPI000EF491EE|nr:cache domain-containing protein [Poseidonibacter antarcticus]